MCFLQPFLAFLDGATIFAVLLEQVSFLPTAGPSHRTKDAVTTSAYGKEETRTSGGSVQTGGCCISIASPHIASVRTVMGCDVFELTAAIDDMATLGFAGNFWLLGVCHDLVNCIDGEERVWSRRVPV
jgi:hypothetical protein